MTGIYGEYQSNDHDAQRTVGEELANTLKDDFEITPLSKTNNKQNIDSSISDREGSLLNNDREIILSDFIKKLESYHSIAKLSLLRKSIS